MSEKLLLRVKEIRHEAEQAITVVLQEANNEVLTYSPGQFLTLVIVINGRELRRSYSLCTTPGIDPYPAITIKRVENGEVSRFLIDHLKVGDELEALHPSGRFTIEVNPLKQRNIFLIGAGSGIVPLFSLLKSILHFEPLSRVILVTSYRDEKSAYYQKELNVLHQQFKGRLEVIEFYSNPLGVDIPRRRLNIGHLEPLVHSLLIHDKEEAEFYVCGPFDFMRMVRMTIIYMGFQEEQFHKENYFPATNYSPLVKEFKAEEIKLVYKDQEYILQVEAGETILNAALRRLIPIPFSCKAGICSTCSGLCTSGKVYMSKNEVLTDKDLKKGIVLTCVAHPETPGVVIQI